MLNESEEKVDIGRYQRLVGKLIYLVHTHLDISFADNILGHSMHSPQVSHLQATYRVLRYLKGTKGWGLHFKCQGMLVQDAYTDSYFAGSLADCKSTMRYYTILAGNTVIWRNKNRMSQDLIFRQDFKL